MSRFLGLYFGTLVRFFRSHPRLLLENLALRQQHVVLKKHDPRPSFSYSTSSSGCSSADAGQAGNRRFSFVTHETVVPWHRVADRNRRIWSARGEWRSFASRCKSKSLLARSPVAGPSPNTFSCPQDVPSRAFCAGPSAAY